MQDSQLDDPTWSWYSPGWHEMQVEIFEAPISTLNLPAGHSRQLVAASLASAYFPDEHTSQPAQFPVKPALH